MMDTIANNEIVEVLSLRNESAAQYSGIVDHHGVLRFDVVATHYPDLDTTLYLKRVVGLPGDMLEIKGGYLYVNGEKFDESYVSDSYRANETWEETIQVPKKGDTVAYDGQAFKVNGAAYPYAYASVSLEGDVTIRALHSTMETADYLYLVKTGGKSYVFYDGNWAEVTETYVSTVENNSNVWYQLNDTSRQKLEAAPTVTGSAVAYYNNEQQPVILKVETTETAPIKEGDFTVAEDSYFVMGDHRNNSRDSRWCGAIPARDLTGIVLRVIWPDDYQRDIVNGLDVQDREP